MTCQFVCEIQLQRRKSPATDNNFKILSTVYDNHTFKSYDMKALWIKQSVHYEYW